MKKTQPPTFSALLIAVLMMLPMSAIAAQSEGDPVFARVNGEQLLVQSYVQSLRNAAKRRFYHGETPEGQLRLFKWEVGQELINQRLFLQESERRGITEDKSWVEQQLTRLIARYSSNPKWQSQKALIIADLRRRLNEKSRLDQLEARVKSVGQPTKDQLEDFYTRNPAKFTAPERIHVSMILLKVDPWLPSNIWEGRMEEGRALLLQIREGGDFREIAREMSEDASASKGGDLGYQHRGMLGETAEKVLDELRPGEVSDAVQVLEGIAIFRLEQRQTAALNPLNKVRVRAIELWQREAKERAMAKLLMRLKRNSTIELVDPIYRKLDAESRELEGEASMISASNGIGG